MSEQTSGSAKTRQMKSLQQEFLHDLLAARRKDAAEKVMNAFRDGQTIPDIYTELLQESLYEVGRLWEANQITVADEHMGTAITQFIMSSLYEHLEVSDVRRGRAVVTGVQGEMHQVGANMVSDVLEADGWQVMFLGADVPPESIVQSVKKHQADLLGISVTLYVNLPRVVELIAMLGRELGPKTPRILLGGGAFAMTDEVPVELKGAMLAHNLHEAIALARQIKR